MAIETFILCSPGDQEPVGAVFRCSTSGLVFGPVWDDYEEGEAFLQWYRSTHGDDLRALRAEQISDLQMEWRVIERESIEPAEINWETKDSESNTYRYHVNQDDRRIRIRENKSTGVCECQVWSAGFGYSAFMESDNLEKAKKVCGRHVAWKAAGRKW